MLNVKVIKYDIENEIKKKRNLHIYYNHHWNIENKSQSTIQQKCHSPLNKIVTHWAEVVNSYNTHKEFQIETHKQAFNDYRKDIEDPPIIYNLKKKTKN